MSSFQSGIEFIQEALAESKKRSEAISAGSGGKSPQYFNWKPGDKKILRFLADDAVTAEFYDFILDKTGATKNFMVDPADPGRLQRFMSPTPGIGWRRNPKSGVLEEPKVRKLSVAMAVLRTEVPRDGKLVLEDFLYEKELADNQTAPARFFGVVQQSISNFWHTLAVSCFARYGTLCDRDYEVSRVGGGLDTKYDIIPLPEVPELSDPATVKSFYGYGAPWDANDPQRFLKCPMTILEWAQYFAGEERYRHWLTPDGGQPPAHTPSGNDEFHPATTLNDEAQASAPVSPAPSSTSFATLQEQLIQAAKNK